jgi:hypothetical protein
MYVLKMSRYRLHGDGELVWLKRSVHSWFLVLKELEKDPKYRYLFTVWYLLVNIPLEDDDEDESQENFAAPEVPSEVGLETPHSIEADMRVEVEESFPNLLTIRKRRNIFPLASAPLFSSRDRKFQKPERLHNLASIERLQALLIVSSVSSSRGGTQHSIQIYSNCHNPSNSCSLFPIQSLHFSPLITGFGSALVK